MCAQCRIADIQVYNHLSLIIIMPKNCTYIVNSFYAEEIKSISFEKNYLQVLRLHKAGDISIFFLNGVILYLKYIIKLHAHSLTMLIFKKFVVWHQQKLRYLKNCQRTPLYI